MSDDLIRRSDAIKAIEDLPHAYNGWWDNCDKPCVIRTLEKVPTVEPKQSEWIRHENPRYSYDREQGNINAGVHYTCSECNYISWTYNFCPNCGAKMKGINDEAD